MKLRDPQSGRGFFLDFVIVLLVGALAYLLYIRGRLDAYLPEAYASTTILAPAEPAGEADSGGPALQPIELGKLDRRFWPKQVSLRRSLEFPIVFEGKPSGFMTAPKGMLVSVVEVRAKEVVVQNGEATKTVAAGDTDILERAQALIHLNGAPPR